MLHLNLSAKRLRRKSTSYLSLNKWVVRRLLLELIARRTGYLVTKKSQA